MSRASLLHRSQVGFEPGTRKKRLFEWLIDLGARAGWGRFPDLHLYHFASYEPSAIKRLMLRYATKEEEVDRLLRGEAFVDLHSVIKQGIRASVEQYLHSRRLRSSANIADGCHSPKQIKHVISSNTNWNWPQVCRI